MPGYVNSNQLKQKNVKENIITNNLQISNISIRSYLIRDVNSTLLISTLKFLPFFFFLAIIDWTINVQRISLVNMNCVFMK